MKLTIQSIILKIVRFTFATYLYKSYSSVQDFRVRFSRRFESTSVLTKWKEDSGFQCCFDYLKKKRNLLWSRIRIRWCCEKSFDWNCSGKRNRNCFIYVFSIIVRKTFENPKQNCVNQFQIRFINVLTEQTKLISSSNLTKWESINQNQIRANWRVGC